MSIKRKEIWLTKEAVEALEKKAQARNQSLKSYMEWVLIKASEKNIIFLEKID